MSLVHKDDLYETPPWLVTHIKNWTATPITLDVCATPGNAIAPNYFTEEDNALNQSWKTEGLAFCNPPRSKNGAFVTKAISEWRNGQDIAILMCWSDFGTNYGAPLFDEYEMCGRYNEYGERHIEIHNLGRVGFFKGGKPTAHKSRNGYLWLYMGRKKQ